MSSADFVQTNGLGSLFHSLIHLRMSSSSSVTLRWADLRSFLFVSSATSGDRLEPRAAGRGEVQAEAGVFQEPLVNRGGLVGGVVVADEVEVQVLRDGGVDELEEPQELLVTMPAVGLGDH